MNQQFPSGQYPYQRPPQRPPMSPEERRRRQEYYRRMRRKRMQRRIALLVIALLFIAVSIVFVTAALQRNTATTGLPDNETTLQNEPQQTDPEPAQTTIAEPETTAPPQTTAPQTTAAPVKDGRITICIDPGHGFDDGGTVSEYLGTVSEKDITLAIALKLRPLLEAAGYRVIMTHDTNQRPSDAPFNELYLFRLADRTEFANTHMPDFFLSIHADSYTDSSVYGTRVYFQTVTGEDNSAITAIGQKFVSAIAATFPSAKTPTLKPMADDTAYYVLRNVNMPSILVEVGFVTNPTDAANMLDDTWQQKMAEAFCKAVKNILPI